MIYRYSSIILIFFCVTAMAQEQEYYLEPSIDVSHKINNRFSTNFGFVSRNEYEDGDLRGNHVQLVNYLNYQSGFYGKLALGFMYRFNKPVSGGDNELRFTQQYTTYRIYNGISLKHRFRLQERIRPNDLIWRIRYRVGLTAPISGFRLDRNELYIVGYLEPVVNFSVGQLAQYDVRVSAGLGYSLGSINLQIIGEYRWEDFLNNTRRRFFIQPGLKLKI